jgi:nucleoside-diphosphate-sugar epimerase
VIVSITGGTGFVGSQLVATLLERSDEVRVLTRRQPDHVGRQRYFVGDLADPGSVEDAFVDGADVVVHLGAELRDASSMMATNVDGTQRLVTMASGRVKKFVYLSSVGVYGPVRKGEVTEDAAENPQGTYELSKQRAEQIVAAAAANGSFGHSILRPSKIYGAGMNLADIGLVLRLVRRRRFVYFGSPEATVSYVHVDDVVGALVALIDSPRAEGAFNVGQPSTMRTLVESAARAFGVPAPSRRVPPRLARMIATVGGLVPRSPITPTRLAALNSSVRYLSDRLAQEVGYCEQVSLADGIGNLVRDSEFGQLR